MKKFAWVRKLLLLSICMTVISQSAFSIVNTVGLTIHDTSSSDGYTLVKGMNSADANLIDEYGRRVHTWSDTTRSFTGYPYILENGHLLTMITLSGDNAHFAEYDWDGNLVWEFISNDTTFTQHHDIAVLPNGNVLIVARQFFTLEEFAGEGRDTVGWIGSPNYSIERILEIEKTGPQSGAVVWEWSIMDHLIQDFDATKNNYGVVEDHPELLDINFTQSPNTNWLHCNGMDYNPILDQIIVSFRHISECLVIDHSTSTAQASGHTGGLQNKGGDIIYRYGNPEAYRAGDFSDKQLSFQHNPQWIPAGFPGEGNLLFFSNGNDWLYSTVVEIVPPVDNTGSYTMPIASGVPYSPVLPEWTYNENPPENFYANFISGCQRLQNGNTLICHGPSGEVREVNNAGDIVWYYINPIGRTGATVQGELPDAILSFRMNRYSLDYPAFLGKSLIPESALEINPVTISYTQTVPNLPTTSDLEIGIQTTIVADVGLASVTAFVDTGSGYFSIVLNDDGNSFDELAGDNIYGASLGEFSSVQTVFYYIEAVDDTSAIVNDPANPPATVFNFVVNYACGNFDGVTQTGEPTDIADLTYLVNYLFKNGPAPVSLEAANVDGNGVEGSLVDIADLTYLVNYLFKGGPPPVC